MRALLVYHTISGHTLQAIENIREGLQSKEVECEIKKVPIKENIDLSNYQIIVIGTPTHALGPARKISEFIKKLPDNSLTGKKIGIITCYAGLAGGKSTLKILESKLKEKGASMPIEKVDIIAGVPLSIIKGPEASQKDQERCKEIGRQLGS